MLALYILNAIQFFSKSIVIKFPIISGFTAAAKQKTTKKPNLNSEESKNIELLDENSSLSVTDMPQSLVQNNTICGNIYVTNQRIVLASYR